MKTFELISIDNKKKPHKRYQLDIHREDIMFVDLEHKSNKTLFVTHQKWKRLNNQSQQSIQKEKNQREKNKSDQNIKKQSIYYKPLPMEFHDYCGICNLKFKNYLEHTQSTQHILNFNNDKYIKYIDNEEMIYKQNEPLEKIMEEIFNENEPMEKIMEESLIENESLEKTMEESLIENEHTEQKLSQIDVVFKEIDDKIRDFVNFYEQLAY